MNHDLKSIYYVYILFDWLGIPRYVGKGKGKRIDRHESCSSSNKMKDEFIEQTWIILGEIPKIFIKENVTELEAFATEIALILAIGRLDQKTGPLTNLTNGGEGSVGKIFHLEARKKLSDSKSKYWNSLNPEERSACRKAVLANLPKEQLAKLIEISKENITKYNKNTPIEVRREISRKTALRLPKEIRIRSGKKSWENVPAEEKSRRAKRANSFITKEQLAENARKAVAATNPLILIERGKRLNKLLSLEQRKLNGKKAAQTIKEKDKTGANDKWKAAISLVRKNKKWINNGITSTTIDRKANLPEGWKYSRIFNYKNVS